MDNWTDKTFGRILKPSSQFSYVQLKLDMDLWMVIYSWTSVFPGHPVPVGRVYLQHLTPDAKPDNSTASEYVCQHSFVWTYLLPRLIFTMGYISVFVCWFCLKQPDFITVVAEVSWSSDCVCLSYSGSCLVAEFCVVGRVR